MKTFLDSCVLLTAWRGKESDSLVAQQIMDDANREFVSSQMVRLELLPKATFFKQRDEVEFYESHFKDVKSCVPLSAELADAAFKLAAEYGLAAADAINVAAALSQGADEFITAETASKALYRVRGIAVRSMRSALKHPSGQTGAGESVPGDEAAQR